MIWNSFHSLKRKQEDGGGGGGGEEEEEESVKVLTVRRKDPRYASDAAVLKEEKDEENKNKNKGHWCRSNSLRTGRLVFRFVFTAVIGIMLLCLNVMGKLFHGLGTALQNAPTPKRFVAVVVVSFVDTGDAETRLGEGPQMTHEKVARYQFLKILLWLII